MTIITTMIEGRLAADHVQGLETEGLTLKFWLLANFYKFKFPPVDHDLIAIVGHTLAVRLEAVRVDPSLDQSRVNVKEAPAAIQERRKARKIPAVDRGAKNWWQRWGMVTRQNRHHQLEETDREVVPGGRLMVTGSQGGHGDLGRRIDHRKNLDSNRKSFCDPLKKFKFTSRKSWRSKKRRRKKRWKSWKEMAATQASCTRDDQRQSIPQSFSRPKKFCKAQHRTCGL